MPHFLLVQRGEEPSLFYKAQFKIFIKAQFKKGG